MAWYEDDAGVDVLDYSKAIMATGKGGDSYLLLPQIDKDGEPNGFNWFNPQTGIYNSSRFWGTAQAAVNWYATTGYVIRNVELLWTTPNKGAGVNGSSERAK